MDVSVAVIIYTKLGKFFILPGFVKYTNEKFRIPYASLKFLAANSQFSRLSMTDAT